MAATVIDSLLFGDQFSTPAMRAVFSDGNTLQTWLDTEAALARAEAAAGIIPKAAAKEIARVARAGLYDLAALKREMDRTKHPIMPLVRAMAAKCRGSAGEYVHWGATTQDIMDTGTVLQLKGAFAEIDAGLEALERALARLARKHRATPMAGRTHGQQALPITFGYKLAVWLAEVRRHRERLSQCRPRVLVGQFAGAVGTLASLGNKGMAVQARMMRELGLGVPEICWHTARDGFAEAASILALAAGTCGKIANEVCVLQRTEIGELEEPNLEGNVGSSTMPHKRNPATSETIVALSRAVAGCVGPALAGLVAEHERYKIGLQAEREFMPRLCCMTDAAIRKTTAVVAGLVVNKAAMRRNLDATRGLLLSEAVMMRLAQSIGRQKAHDVVHHACAEVLDNGVPLIEALRKAPAVRKALTERQIRALLDPEAYTGLSTAFVDKVLAAGKNARRRRRSS